MSYIASILQPGENIRIVGKLHWIIYNKAGLTFLLALVAFYFGIQADSSARVVLFSISNILLVASLLMALSAWFNQWITEIAVTDRRVIYKHGFIKRVTAEMNMDKVESVDVTQSILGRLLNYGSIHVRGTGEGLEHLHRIRAPIELRNSITAG